MLIGVAVGCDRKDAVPERTEPWLRASAPAATPPTPPLVFIPEPLAEIRFSAPAKTGTPTGLFRAVGGRIRVALGDLGATRGELRVDLTSVALDADSPDEAVSRTGQARAWLGVGTSLPEAVLERQRWAVFTIERVTELTQSRAELGELVRAPFGDTPDVAAPDAALDGSDSQQAQSGPPRETRRIRFNASGALELHSFRVPASAALRADFQYAGPAQPGAVPERVLVATEQPLRVALDAHDIKPRSATGVLIAQDMKLLGTSVGRTARVSVEVRLKPEDAGRKVP